MAVITISRLYGAGGRRFGLRLAKTLGYEYFDKEILELLSDRLGQDRRRLGLYEEAGYGPSDSLLEMIGRKYPSVRSDFPTSEGYAGAVASILNELAARDCVVIVGRGGQALLSERPGALHLRVIAGVDYLEENLRERPSLRDLGEKELRRRIARQNEIRRKFVLKHFGLDWSEPLAYHLVMNMARLGPEMAEAAVLALVAKSGQPSPAS